MRILSIAIASMAIAVGGLLTISVSDTAFANTKHVTHGCGFEMM